MFDRLKKYLNELAERYKWLNSLRLLVLSFKFILSFTKKETFVSILSWASVVMLGVFKSIDWYWAIVLSTPTIAGGLYLYENIYKKNRFPLLVEFKETCWDRMDNKDLLWCNIVNSSSKGLSDVEIVLVYDDRGYTYPKLGLNRGQEKRIDLLSVCYNHSHYGVKYTEKTIHIEGDNPYLKDYGFEFDNEYKFKINVTAENMSLSSTCFALTIKPGSSTQMDYKIVAM
jgi:hypothetical protein